MRIKSLTDKRKQNQLFKANINGIVILEFFIKTLYNIRIRAPSVVFYGL